MKRSFQGSGLVIIVTTTILLLLSNCTIKQLDDDYDHLIYGGTITDGTGSPTYKADIIVHEGLIAKIGKFDPDNTDARHITNASGMMICPGFIDMQAHGDPIATPGFGNFISMGVTTILLGQDGISPAHISEWMEDVKTAAPAINIASLVGHGTLRDESGVMTDTYLSEEKEKDMVLMLKEAMEAGCFGISFAPDMQPGSYARKEELSTMASQTAKRKGIIKAHIRSREKDKLEASLNELLDMAASSKAPLHISHIYLTDCKGDSLAARILSQVSAARKKGLKITGDISLYSNELFQESLLMDEYITLSSDGSPSKGTPEGYGSFAKYIREYVIEKQLVEQEQAIYKLSGFPAKILCLDKQNRGILKKGYAADLLIFDPGNIKDHANENDPHIQATGFNDVMVNGVFVKKDGALTGKRAGQVLRKQ